MMAKSALFSLGDQTFPFTPLSQLIGMKYEPIEESDFIGLMRLDQIQLMEALRDFSGMHKTFETLEAARNISFT